MDFLQLKYFLVVARLENITRAAEELHITQPSLSKTIARLEANVGVPLFDRHGRRIRLNEFGKSFLGRVKQSFRELEEGQREIIDLAGVKSGRIIVGATTSRMLPSLFSEYLKENPYVKFRLNQVLQQAELQKLLINGEIDLCISTLPINHLEIHCQELLTEKIFLAVPPDHQLSSQRSIKLSEIADDPLVYYTSECGLRQIMDNYCFQAEYVPNIAFECATPEVICGLVQGGFGVAFIPEYMWEIINTDSIVKLRIEDPPCQRTIWLSWDKEHYLSLAVRDFTQFVIEYFSRW